MFTLQEIKHRYTYGADVFAELLFQAVYANGDPERDTFNKATPSGELRMSVTNPAVLDALEIGKTYYLDFTPAD